MSSKHFHTVVWIDHREAKILNFNADVYEELTVHSTHPDQHLHHKANSGDSGHAPPDHEFLKHVATSVADAGALLIVGRRARNTNLPSTSRITRALLQDESRRAEHGPPFGRHHRGIRASLLQSG